MAWYNPVDWYKGVKGWDDKAHKETHEWMPFNQEKGFDEAAAGAARAQEQFQQLAALQWARQMQGLGMAADSMGTRRSLYDHIYGTNTQQMFDGSQLGQASRPTQQAPAGAPPAMPPALQVLAKQNGMAR